MLLSSVFTLSCYACAYDCDPSENQALFSSIHYALNKSTSTIIWQLWIHVLDESLSYTFFVVTCRPSVRRLSWFWLGSRCCGFLGRCLGLRRHCFWLSAGWRWGLCTYKISMQRKHVNIINMIGVVASLHRCAYARACACAYARARTWAYARARAYAYARARACAYGREVK